MSGSSIGRRSMTLWPVLTLVTAALLLAGCGKDNTTGTSPPTSTSPSASTTVPTTSAAEPSASSAATGATTPDGAIQAWMGEQAFDYAGVCKAITPGTHVGAKCSTLYADRGEQKVYRIGPTFSEYNTWLLVEQSGGTWRVVQTAKLTHTGPATPPW